jgi:hypothetical protein
VDFALAVHAYTLENPSIYRVINGEMFSPEREKGTGGVSDRLRTCMPFIKYLDTALDSLPPQFIYKGRCLRGVKWVFPNVESHDPVDFFQTGKKISFYEFKSTSSRMELMYEERFCGKEGARTIFDITACQVSLIKAPNCVDREAAVLIGVTDCQANFCLAIMHTTGVQDRGFLVFR